MKQDRINGFDKNQLFQLYAYLVAYEESGIEKYKSTKAVMDEHPELSDIRNAVKLVKCNTVHSCEMRDVDFKALTNEVYLTKNKGNQLLSLLAHLRNSIAHGNAVEYYGRVLITDFENPKYHRPVNFTARGCIEFDTINSITDILKKIDL